MKLTQKSMQQNIMKASKSVTKPVYPNCPMLTRPKIYGNVGNHRKDPLENSDICFRSSKIWFANSYTKLNCRIAD